ncbi:sec-independent protein translocase protein TatB [Sphingomonas palmae]|uniref:Sec-independent protein translocase protein TatB n=1 Tax=Sphingomonas palmae TaxID=1855283 RepID=A0A1H7Q7P4_9SPHN|nr:Sec-independent protein translocase protein TatB [Sphingomonas palmae]SEL44191.1 sec-independent protein translocase protein TatB [Sphingomonas palmae]
MFDIAPSEFLLVAFIALVVIGPKDLPKALRVVGYWVGRARAVGRQFRSGFDEMVREAELAEMEKKWKAENERIMREHANPLADAGDGATALPAPAGEEAAPVMVARPQMIEHPRVVASDGDAGASSDLAGAHDVSSREKPAPIDKAQS